LVPKQAAPKYIYPDSILTDVAYIAFG